MTNTKPSIREIQPFAHLPSLCISLGSTSRQSRKDLASVIYAEVNQIILSVGCSIQQTISSYFDGFHGWLPIVRPRHFVEAMPTNIGCPDPEVSLLLMTMCLIVVEPKVCELEPSLLLDSLYISVQGLFTYVQRHHCISLCLLQAVILITAFEYAVGRLEEARITIGVYARISALIGVNKETSVFELYQQNHDQASMTAEKWNVWWGVLVMER